MTYYMQTSSKDARLGFSNASRLFAWLVFQH